MKSIIIRIRMFKLNHNNFLILLSTFVFLLLNFYSIADEKFSKLAIQRENEFEFIAKPTLENEKDNYLISFETKAYCDATVSIEDSQGNIVRHLASGVLGANAPKPFQSNSKKQKIPWDGKNDLGKYLDEKDEFYIRVSLGLKAQFERTLFWSPYKKGSLYTDPLSFQSCDDGVYVLDSGLIGPDFAPQLKLFTQNGEYQNSIYPFPASQIENITGLDFHTYAPDNNKFPIKWGYGQTNLLTAGGPNINALVAPSKSKEIPLQTLAIQEGNNGCVYLIGNYINRFSKNGNKLGAPLQGPKVEIVFDNKREPEKSQNYLPESATLSPDGKLLYLTGYKYRSEWNSWSYLQAVTVVDPNGTETPKIFAGKLTPDSGLENEAFTTPSSVDCDTKGNVYVSDYLNHRIQVYKPDGYLLKSIKVKRPAKVLVDKKTGEIYVFSWLIKSLILKNRIGTNYDLNEKGIPEEQLTVFKSLENPEIKTLLDLPTKRPAYESLSTGSASVYNDGNKVWVWLACGNGMHSTCFYDAFSKMNARIYSISKDKNGIDILKPEIDFHNDAIKAIVQAKPPRHGRQRLYCNPANGHLYIGELVFPHAEHFKSFDELIHIDPNSGKTEINQLPFNSEDMAFDINGNAYLRTENWVVRYDLKSMKEIPFDYGQEAQKVGFQESGRSTSIISGIKITGEKGPSSFQLGGIDVSANGNIAVTYYFSDSYLAGNQIKNGYFPKVFPGRDRSWVIHVWDKFGKLKYEDAFPGVKRPDDIAIDVDDNLYALTRGIGSNSTEKFQNLWSTTLIKAKAGNAKVLTDRETTIPLPKSSEPSRKPELTNANAFDGNSWVENAEWLYGGVGIDGKGPCHCEANSQIALDYFKRSFVVETHRSDVVVIDTSGNTVLRIGKYGNIEDGLPLIKDGGPKNPRSIGGDEVAIISVKFLATHTDKRLFLADIANQRILSIKLFYHTEEKIKLNIK